MFTEKRDAVVFLPEFHPRGATAAALVPLLASRAAALPLSEGAPTISWS